MSLVEIICEADFDLNGAFVSLWNRLIFVHQKVHERCETYGAGKYVKFLVVTWLLGVNI